MNIHNLIINVLYILTIIMFSEQPETVEEHFKIIMTDNTNINSQFLRVNAEDLPDWLDDRLFKMFVLNIIFLQK